MVMTAEDVSSVVNRTMLAQVDVQDDDDSVTTLL